MYENTKKFMQNYREDRLKERQQKLNDFYLPIKNIDDKSKLASIQYNIYLGNNSLVKSDALGNLVWETLDKSMKLQTTKDTYSTIQKRQISPLNHSAQSPGSGTQASQNSYSFLKNQVQYQKLFNNSIVKESPRFLVQMTQNRQISPPFKQYSEYEPQHNQKSALQYEGYEPQARNSGQESTSKVYSQINSSFKFQFNQAINNNNLIGNTNSTYSKNSDQAPNKAAPAAFEIGPLSREQNRNEIKEDPNTLHMKKSKNSTSNNNQFLFGQDQNRDNIDLLEESSTYRKGKVAASEIGGFNSIQSFDQQLQSNELSKYNHTLKELQQQENKFLSFNRARQKDLEGGGGVGGGGSSADPKSQTENYSKQSNQKSGSDLSANQTSQQDRSSQETAASRDIKLIKSNFYQSTDLLYESIRSAAAKSTQIQKSYNALDSDKFKLENLCQNSNLTSIKEDYFFIDAPQPQTQLHQDLHHLGQLFQNRQRSQSSFTKLKPIETTSNNLEPEINGVRQIIPSPAPPTQLHSYAYHPLLSPSPKSNSENSQLNLPQKFLFNRADFINYKQEWDFLQKFFAEKGIIDKPNIRKAMGQRLQLADPSRNINPQPQGQSDVPNPISDPQENINADDQSQQFTIVNFDQTNSRSVSLRRKNNQSPVNLHSSQFQNQLPLEISPHHSSFINSQLTYIEQLQNLQQNLQQQILEQHLNKQQHGEVYQQIYHARDPIYNISQSRGLNKRQNSTQDLLPDVNNNSSIDPATQNSSQFGISSINQSPPIAKLHSRQFKQKSQSRDVSFDMNQISPWSSEDEAQIQPQVSEVNDLF